MRVLETPISSAGDKNLPSDIRFSPLAAGLRRSLNAEISVHCADLKHPFFILILKHLLHLANATKGGATSGLLYSRSNRTAPLILFRQMLEFDTQTVR